MKLEGKVAIVTGGASGIGRACAELWAKEGATVVVADVNEEDGQAVAEAINGMFVKTDVSVAEEVEALVNAAVEAYGKLDIMFNNAGIDGKQAPIADSSLENYHNVMKINMDGVFYGMKYALLQMREQGSGTILNTSSTAGLVGFPNIAPYSASKSGINNLMRAAVAAHAAEGIRVNAIAPSVVDTPLVQNFIEESEDPEATREQFANLNPYPGIVSMESVAATALFLVS
ncbi:MAG: SDR family NAD(P)-dependent oxidoreductase, partial [Chloroflexota bacterium]